MNNLNWNDKSDIELEFPVRYWKWLEDLFSQFAEGEHIASKAFEGRNDYLGFTDDYDFCWGAEELGEGLEEQVYPDGWHTDQATGIEYTIKDYGYREYTEEAGRLWGVYQKSIGEIYLLKANEELTDWEVNQELLFAPTGSQKPTIEFNPEGYYEIAVEVTVAGTGVKEIWLMSYPYEGSSIRKICDGASPILTFNHDKNMVLFYTEQEQTNIYYRLEQEDYETEHEINIIFEPERELDFINSFKIDKEIELEKPFVEFEGYAKDVSGRLIVFLKRDDDYRPYKYTYTGEVYRYEFDYRVPIINPFLKEKSTAFDINLSGIQWEDMRYILNVFSDEYADVYFEGQKEQESIGTTLDENGEGSIVILPYETVYNVFIEKDGYVEESWGVLAFDSDETKMMDINIPILYDDSKPTEYFNPNINVDIEWIAVTVSLNLHHFKDENDLENSTITIVGQSEQETIEVVTDSEGKAVVSAINPYETVYQVLLDPEDMEINDKISLLVDFEPGSVVDIELPYVDDSLETAIIDIGILPEWETMYITTTITLKDLAGNPIDGADITIKAQRDMPEINLTTDVNGQATEDLLVYDTVYNFISSKTGYETEDNLALLVENTETKSRDVDMYMTDGELEREENTNINIAIDSCLWLEV